MKKKVKTIGLTGSIASGKSTIAKMFARHGASIFNADLTVHDLLANDKKTYSFISKEIPEALWQGNISKTRLARAIFSNPQKRELVEAFLHPRVRQQAAGFIRQKRQEGASCVVLDVPLLFEAGFDDLCDVVCCAFAQNSIQKERALQRKGMTAEKFRAISKRQWPATKKKQRADVVFRTDVDKKETQRQVDTFYERFVKEKR